MKGNNMAITKKPFRFNNNGVKDSCDMYRNIKGVHYEQLTADGGLFEELKAEAKSKGLRTKIIVGELFIEVIT